MGGVSPRKPTPGRSRLSCLPAALAAPLRLVHRLERDLPELLSFYSFPRHLWKKLRTNIIERCFVEVRRRTRIRRT